MRHPAGSPLLCVNCGRETTTEASAAQAAPAPAPEPAEPEDAPRAVAALALPQANGVGHSGSCSDEEEGEEAGLLPAPPPLRTRLYAALAAAQPADDSIGTSGAPLADSLRQAAPAGAARPPAAGPQAGRQQGRDASKEIAELMLDGWAMLADHCPM